MLLTLAVLPGIVLMVYVYRKDKIEKEPCGLLALLFLCGVASCIPAAVTELLLDKPLTAIFGTEGYLYYLVEAFVGVALVEEACKYIALRWITWKNRNFNYRFDGIVYAVFVSLGFAVLENVMYVSENGFGTAVMRAVVSVPGHMMFGVFMGMYYGIARHAANCGQVAAQKRAQKSALLVPVLIHGFFDFCLFTGSILFIAVFFVFMIFLYSKAFGNLKKYSLNDYPIS